MTFNLTCGKGVTELQNLTNLRLSSFAESHQMQQKNFDISPNGWPLIGHNIVKLRIRNERAARDLVSDYGVWGATQQGVASHVLPLQTKGRRGFTNVEGEGGAYIRF